MAGYTFSWRGNVDNLHLYPPDLSLVVVVSSKHDGLKSIMAELWRGSYPHVGDMWITGRDVAALPPSAGLFDRKMAWREEEMAECGRVKV